MKKCQTRIPGCTDCSSDGSTCRQCEENRILKNNQCLIKCDDVRFFDVTR